MTRRGFTLAEILVAAALSLVVLTVAVNLFRLTGRMAHVSSSAYMLTRDLQEAVRLLRLDLRETALTAVRVSRPAVDRHPPGLSLVSARDGTGATVLDPSGAPSWQRWVLYSLDVKPGAVSGDLVRWESEHPSGLPELCPLLPSAFPRGSRVVLRNVAAPNQQFRNGMGTGADGGFLVEYVRYGAGQTYETSPYNPGEVSQGKAPGLDLTGNSRMVQVHLKLVQENSLVDLTFRVTPRY